MLFRETTPKSDLNLFVKSFWRMEFERSEKEFVERILPDGSTEIIFHLGEKVSRLLEDGKFESEPEALFIRQNSRQYKIAAKGRVKMLGVKFHPHVAPFLLREDAFRLTDATLDLHDFWQKDFANIFDEVRETSRFERQVSTLESFLNKRADRRKSFQTSYLQYATNRLIQAKGLFSLDKLATEIGISNRYLQKLFTNFVGLSPKVFSQILQLQNSLQILKQNPTLSLTETAYAAGYSDQSHFIRAVKRFSGVTPARLLKENLLMQNPFLQTGEK